MDRCTGYLLLVEDHESTRHVLGAIFRRRGWRVLTASTVAEGMALLDQAPEPDCLILDLMLPDGPGETLLRAIRSRRMRTRVAVTTATYDPARLCGVSAMEPEGLFQKPVDLDGLCRACESV